jgi:hypothetical protein
MPLTLSRKVINSLWPEGSFWVPKTGSDYDKLLDGVADNSEAVRLDLKELAQLRNPRLTPILSDLEKEFAVIPSSGATETERRDRLRATMFKRSSPGTAEYLQASLRDAGFDGAYVYNNSPAADPRDFIEQSFNMVCGDTLPSGNLAQCGEAEAICAELGGELIVNGDLMEMQYAYRWTCASVFGMTPEERRPRARPSAVTVHVLEIFPRILRLLLTRSTRFPLIQVIGRLYFLSVELPRVTLTE